MPLLPTARAVEAYSLLNAEDFAYMKEVAYRTGGFGLGLAIMLGLLLSSFFFCMAARWDGRLFTAGDFGPRIFSICQRRWRKRRQRRSARRASAEAPKARALEIQLAEGRQRLSGNSDTDQFYDSGARYRDMHKEKIESKGDGDRQDESEGNAGNVISANAIPSSELHDTRQTTQSAKAIATESDTVIIAKPSIPACGIAFCVLLQLVVLFPPAIVAQVAEAHAREDVDLALTRLIKLAREGQNQICSSQCISSNSADVQAHIVRTKVAAAAGSRRWTALLGDGATQVEAAATAALKSEAVADDTKLMQLAAAVSCAGICSTASGNSSRQDSQASQWLTSPLSVEELIRSAAVNGSDRVWGSDGLAAYTTALVAHADDILWIIQSDAKHFKDALRRRFQVATAALAEAAAESSELAAALKAATEAGEAARSRLGWLQTRHADGGTPTWSLLPLPMAVARPNNGGGNVANHGNITAMERVARGEAAVALATLRFKAEAGAINATASLVLGERTTPPNVLADAVHNAAATAAVAITAIHAAMLQISSNASARDRTTISTAMSRANAIAALTAHTCNSSINRSVWVGEVDAPITSTGRCNAVADAAEAALAVRSRAARIAQTLQAGSAALGTPRGAMAEAMRWRADWRSDKTSFGRWGRFALSLSGSSAGGGFFSLGCYAATVPSLVALAALAAVFLRPALKARTARRRVQHAKRAVEALAHAAAETETQAAAEAVAHNASIQGTGESHLFSKINDSATISGDGSPGVGPAPSLAWAKDVGRSGTGTYEAKVAAAEAQAKAQKRAQRDAAARAKSHATIAAVLRQYRCARRAAQLATCAGCTWAFILALVTGAVLTVSTVLGDVCSSGAYVDGSTTLFLHRFAAANIGNFTANMALGRRTRALPRSAQPPAIPAVGEAIVSAPLMDSNVMKRVLECTAAPASASFCNAPCVSGYSLLDALGMSPLAFDWNEEFELGVASLVHMLNTSGVDHVLNARVGISPGAGALSDVIPAAAAVSAAAAAAAGLPNITSITSKGVTEAAATVAAAAREHGALEREHGMNVSARQLDLLAHATEFVVFAHGNTSGDDWYRDASPDGAKWPGLNHTAGTALYGAEHVFSNASTHIILVQLAQARANLPELTLNPSGNWQMSAANSSERDKLQKSFLDLGARLSDVAPDPSSRHYPAFPSWSLFMDALDDVNNQAQLVHSGVRPYNLDTVRPLIVAVVAANEAGTDAINVGIQVNASLHYRTAAMSALDTAACCTLTPSAFEVLVAGVKRCRTYHTILYGGLDTAAMWVHSRSASAPGILVDVLHTRWAIDNSTFALRAQLEGASRAGRAQRNLRRLGPAAASAIHDVAETAANASAVLRSHVASVRALAAAAGAGARSASKCAASSNTWKALISRDSTGSNFGAICGGAAAQGGSGLTNVHELWPVFGHGVGGDLRILAAATLTSCSVLALCVPILSIAAAALLDVERQAYQAERRAAASAAPRSGRDAERDTQSGKISDLAPGTQFGEVSSIDEESLAV